MLGKKESTKQIWINETSKILRILCFYIILSLPLVQWPGTVIRFGIPNFIKAVIFYYYTVSLIDTEKKLKLFILIFLSCQTFRILEPLYLHITTGYWGSFASMANWEFMNRLAGAPHDIINPNGLAFVIVTVIPFYHYLSFVSLTNKLIYLSTIPVFIYALILTGSRSGFIALLIILFGILIKSQKKILLIGIMGLAAIIVFANLTPVQKDRYASIFDKSSANYGTAHGRTEGVTNSFKVALRKPIVGHGLGTSLEANYHVIGYAQRAHNLYAEVMQELGTIGLLIFVLFIKSIIFNFYHVLQKMKDSSTNNTYLLNLTHAMQVWLLMNIIFSFASYGLSSYEWYLFGGFSIVLKSVYQKHDAIIKTI